MDSEQAKAFLQALNAKQIRIKANGWVEASCPLAPWRHKNHKDTSPSFGLSIAPGDRSYYQCFACQSGTAEELVQTLELYTLGKHEAAYYNFKLAHQLLENEVQLMPLPEYEEHGPASKMFEEWPLYWLHSFIPVDAKSEPVDYLVGRKVSITTAKQFDLRYDTKRCMIVAPYWDVFGRFAGARGRSILSGVTGHQKHYDYSFQGRNNARLCWYNERVLDTTGPAVVVEGQFDCWRVAQVYPKVVAALMAKPSWEKMKKLGDCPFIIQIPDRDETGKISTEVYKKFCAQLGIGYKELWLDEGVKDPDEAHPEYLRDRINELL